MNHTTLALGAILIAAGVLGTISVQLAPQPAHAQTGGCAAAGAGSGGAASGAINSGSGQTCGTGGGATEGACLATSTTVACRGQ